ncbi:MAG: flagellar biosynthetic protein FliQ [Candidatus Aureabacteria bacterium]|nr:flagellar biosynthetic protein FliQ [Candidatus Auribacterota bacterium]
MNVEMIVRIGEDTIITLLYMSAPLLIVGAVIGIVVSMLQTVTQLKDQSLTFIPKIVGIFIVLIFAAPFLIKTIVDYTNRLYSLAEQLGRGIL